MCEREIMCAKERKREKGDRGRDIDREGKRERESNVGFFTMQNYVVTLPIVITSISDKNNKTILKNLLFQVPKLI